MGAAVVFSIPHVQSNDTITGEPWRFNTAELYLSTKVYNGKPIMIERLCCWHAARRHITQGEGSKEQKTVPPYGIEQKTERWNMVFKGTEIYTRVFPHEPLDHLPRSLSDRIGLCVEYTATG